MTPLPDAAVQAAIAAVHTHNETGLWYTAENAPPGFEDGDPMTDADEERACVLAVLEAATREVRCWHCEGGSLKFRDDKPCKVCGGSGVLFVLKADPK